MVFLLQVLAALGQIVLSFYGFWLIWRILLPELPGPADPEDRIAPYAGYFTDPFVRPLARVLHAPPRSIVLLVLLLIGVASAAIAHVPDLAR